MAKPTDRITVSLLLDEGQIATLLRAMRKTQAANKIDLCVGRTLGLHFSRADGLIALLYEAEAQANDAWHDANATETTG